MSGHLAARTPSESRALRDNLIGADALDSRIPIPEFIAVTDPDIRRHFASLENDIQRQGYLDELLEKLKYSIHGWVKFYEAASILREQRRYWRHLGYSSFEEFWRDRAGPTFRSFKELEDVFCFAKIACPELFNMDTRNTRRLYGQLDKLNSSASRRSRINRVTGRKRVFESVDEARVAIIHAMKWSMVSNRSFEYRVYRIKRDRPDVAAQLLAGKYFKRLASGLYAIDLIRAEREAFGESSPHRKVQPIASKVRRAMPDSSIASEDVVVLEEVDHVIDVASHSRQVRAQIIDRLRAVPWVVRALSASGTPK
jgi:hypothetical protein